MLIRSWNVYHGRSHPAGRRGHLRAAIELASADEPDVLCLQELPLWSLARLERWSSMRAFTARTKRAPLGAHVGRAVTSTHYGVLRSAFTGQANAILVGAGHPATDLGGLVISDRRHHPRVCHAVRVGERLVVANIHASGDVAQRQVDRALVWLGDLVHDGEPVVLAGDFNSSLTLLEASRRRTVASTTCSSAAWRPRRSSSGRSSGDGRMASCSPTTRPSS